MMGTGAPAAEPVTIEEDAGAVIAFGPRSLVATTRVNYRTGPGTGYPRLGQLTPGTPVIADGRIDPWYRIRADDGGTAYVHGDYLMPLGDGRDTILALEPRAFVTTANLNYRAGPGTEHLHLGRLSAGTEVSVDGQVDGWYRVRVGGAHAFAHADFLAPREGPPLPAVAPTDPRYYLARVETPAFADDSEPRVGLDGFEWLFGDPPARLHLLASSAAGDELEPPTAHQLDPETLLAQSTQRRPGVEPRVDVEPEVPDPNVRSGLERVNPPDRLAPAEFVPIPDRWRLAKDLGVVEERWFDPYNRNILKADRPLFDDWFFNFSLISDTVFEQRKLPTPVAPQVTRGPGALDTFGGLNQTLWNQNLILALVAYKGDTVFRPPDYELRITPIFNVNYTRVDELRALKIDPSKGPDRTDNHVAIQELFFDVHLRNVSDRYDFDSIRVGIQPFSTDFRGFLFQDNQLGVRLFGNRDNNLWQYNLAWFRRLEKDTNSGLNDITERVRDDDIFIANLYRQDWPVLGFFSQGTVVHNRNREDKELFFDTNGFLQRPASIGAERLRDYDVTYIGYNGDGHIGRLNLTASAYYAFGDESEGLFNGRPSDIRAYFAAAEASVDFDWVRLRVSGLIASGDDDPFDDRSEGFDAIFENPIFAGADTSFWVRQAVPFIGGGGVALSARNGVLASLRASKEHGQSNFTNPGLRLVGIGAEFDISPEIRFSANLNHLAFDNTSVLEVARNQGKIDSDIGWDLSGALIYRPFFSQNVVFRLSAAALFPSEGFKDLFGKDRSLSVLGNLVLTF